MWERDLGLLYSFLELKFLNVEILEWMFSGVKIVIVYDRRNEEKGYLIVFFERNGLERSLFSINELVDVVVEVLKWNCNFDFLVVIVRCEGYYCVKIWFFSNNYWYLK